LMTNLDTYHLFGLRPTYRKIAHLPLPLRVAEMRRPEVRDAILGEEDVPEGTDDLSLALAKLFEIGLPLTFPLSDPIDYEPDLERSVFMRAMAASVSPASYMYDLLLADEGKAFYALLGSNFVSGTLEVCREMMLDVNTVTGLGDAGAHVKLISDCSAPTFHLTHWARDRTRGDRLPLELLVQKLTKGNADLYGFANRGVVKAGKRADLNVIDFDNLRILEPELRRDLPTGGGRILQPAEGYLATLVNGVPTRICGLDTGDRPGRLVRGRPAHPAAA
jgi:N-acyl-D-amino-acid deacylase